MPLAFNCLGCALCDAPTQDAPGSWKGVCATCATAPICVPCDRVRLCAENIGKWSVRRDPFHLWDTGKGAVVSARKFYLTPSPDGNVAIVFRSAAEAKIVDGLLGGSVVQPTKSFPLRYCTGSKTFCSSMCFGSESESCCLAHKPCRMNLREAPKPSAKRQNAEVAADDNKSWLPKWANFLGAEEAGDDLSFESLRELCDVQQGAEFSLKDDCRQSSPVHSESSRSTISVPASPPNDDLFDSFDGLWEAPTGESDDVLSSLDHLLGEPTADAGEGMAIDLDSAASFDALACFAPLPAAAPAPPRPRPQAGTPGPAVPRAKTPPYAAKWRPSTGLPCGRVPAMSPAGMPPLPAVAKPAVSKPSPTIAKKPTKQATPKSVKGKAVWKAAIVL